MWGSGGWRCWLIRLCWLSVGRRWTLVSGLGSLWIACVRLLLPCVLTLVWPLRRLLGRFGTLIADRCLGWRAWRRSPAFPRYLIVVHDKVSGKSASVPSQHQQSHQSSSSRNDQKQEPVQHRPPKPRRRPVERNPPRPGEQERKRSTGQHKLQLIPTPKEPTRPLQHDQVGQQTQHPSRRQRRKQAKHHQSTRNQLGTTGHPDQHRHMLVAGEDQQATQPGTAHAVEQPEQLLQTVG